MGAPGGAAFMGQSFSMLAKGLKEAFSHWGKVGFHKGLPTVKDIPLLIKALSLNGPGIADEAHSALVWLSGGDLGREARAWSAWWKTYGAELARREADEKAARDLFLNVKRDILTGRWDAVGRALSAELRGRARPDELRKFLLRSAPLLRKVYRDAEVRELRLDGDSGTLAVDWGKSGFEFTETEIVRQAGAWKFARAPWGRRVVARRPREIVNIRPAERPRPVPVKRPKPAGAAPHGKSPLRRPLRRARALDDSPWLKLCFILAALLATVLVVLVMPCGVDGATWTSWKDVLGMAAISLPIASFPIIFFYVLFFGRIRRSREIREEFHRRRA